MLDKLRRMPIRAKILGLTITIMSVMLAVSIASYVLLTNVNNQLEVVSRWVIPVSNQVNKIQVLYHRQQVTFERAIKNLSQQERDPKQVQRDQEVFRVNGLQVDKEINVAKRGLKPVAVKPPRFTQETHTLGGVFARLDDIDQKYQNWHDKAWNTIIYKELRNATLYDVFAEQLASESTELEESISSVQKTLGVLSSRSSQEVLAGGRSIHHWGVLLSCLVFMVALLVAIRIARHIVRPVQRMITSANAIAEGDLDVHIPVDSGDEVGQLAGAFGKMAKELRHKEQIKETFGKYVDPRIVESLIDEGGLQEMKDSHKQVMTVFFSDVEKFSTITESLTPGGLVKLINKYFSLVSEPVVRNNGVIDKFIGDAVMAFWGPPFTGEDDHASLACSAALEQFERLEELHLAMPELLGFRKGLPKVNFRVGLCTGELVAGNIGSNVSRSFTVMGDTVNIAARLESANKQYNTRILMAEQTQQLVADEFETRRVDNIVVVGKLEPVSVYELMGYAGKLESPALKLRDSYELALTHYLGQRWDEANRSLQACLEINPKDGPSGVLLERIKAFTETPPADDWDGVWRMTHK